MTPTSDPPTGDGRAVLEASGLRVTAPRLAMLDALDGRPHGHVEAIADAAREQLGTLSKQAAYDILGVFVQEGLARRIEPAGSPARFEARVGDNHHHVVCRACGAVADVDCVTGDPPCLQPSASDGFVIDEAEVTFWGRCPDCRAPAEEPTAPATATAD